MVQADCAPESWAILVAATMAAAKTGGGVVGTPHLFAGMRHGPEAPLARGLRRLGVSIDATADTNRGRQSERLPTNVRCSASAHEILTTAKEAAISDGKRVVSAQDLLAAFVRHGGGSTGKWLRTKGVVLEALTSRLVLDDGRLDPSRFSETGRRIAENMVECARRKGYPVVGRRHLLYALLSDASGILSKRLREQDLDGERLADLLYATMRSGAANERPSIARISNMSTDLVRVLFGAEREALSKGVEVVGDVDLLTALLADGGGAAGEFLVRNGVRLRRLQQPHAKEQTR